MAKGRADDNDRLVAAIQQWMDRNGITSRPVFAGMAGISKDRVAKWFNRGDYIPLHVLEEMEAHLGLPKGHFLIEAGFVDIEPSDFVQLIHSRIELTGKQQDALIHFWEAYVNSNQADKKRPKRPKTSEQ